MARPAALKLTHKFDPDTLDLDLADAWAEAIAADEARLAAVLEEDGPIACDQVPTVA